MSNPYSILLTIVKYVFWGAGAYCLYRLGYWGGVRDMFDPITRKRLMDSLSHDDNDRREMLELLGREQFDE